MMNSDMLWIVLLTLAAGPVAAAEVEQGSSYTERVQAADGSGPAASAEASLHRGAKKAGHAVKAGVKKTGQVIGKGLQKTGEAVDHAGEKLEDKSR